MKHDTETWDVYKIENELRMTCCGDVVDSDHEAGGWMMEFNIVDDGVGEAMWRHHVSPNTQEWPHHQHSSGGRLAGRDIHCIVVAGSSQPQTEFVQKSTLQTQSFVSETFVNHQEVDM